LASLDPYRPGLNGGLVPPSGIPDGILQVRSG
jgi:hypothetical protein